MTSSKYSSNPERLVDGPFGRLLKDANREFAGELDQPAAFQRVTERLSPSLPVSPRRGYWLAPVTLLVLAGVVALPALLVAVQRLRAETPTLVAEDLHGFNVKVAVVTSAANEASPRIESPLKRAESNRASEATPNAQSSSAPAAAGSDRGPLIRGATQTLDPTPAPAPNPAPSAATESPSPSPETSLAPDCLSLARLGRTRDAEACFLKRAEGSGLGAEMALYEVARLRRDVLADAAGALAALAEYRRRFPTGSLRREADMSQLELLLQLGRSDEALKQSDELLSSSASGERAAELHLLRGHILRKAQARFAEAAREYELAETAGMRGGDITYYRALCLEALGRAPEAAALFARYLEQSQRSYAEDARRRLEKLTP